MNNSNEQSNKGVFISGGNVNVRDMAVGDNASIQSSNQNLSENKRDLHDEIANLITLMKNENVSQDKIEATVLAKNELEKEQPNDVVVKSVMTGVLESLKDISSISSSVAAVAALLFG